MHGFEVEGAWKAAPSSSCISKGWNQKGIWYPFPELQDTEAPLWLRPRQITSKHLYIQYRSTKHQFFSSLFQGCKYCWLETCLGCFFLFSSNEKASPPAIWSGSCSAKHISSGECIHSIFHNTDLESEGTFAADLNLRQTLEQYKAIWAEQYKAIWASQQSRADLLPALLQP